MDADEPTPTPRGWGSDELSKFIDLARDHVFGTVHNLPNWYAQVRAVDDAFVRFVRDWRDPDSPFAASMALRAFSAYRATAQLAFAGQIPEAYMVMRGCLECMLYGHYVHAVPASWDIWRNRGDSEDARKQCVRTFSGSNLISSLEARNADIAKGARMLYERAIDLGAHPNELAMISTMEVEDRNDGGRFLLHSFLSGDTDALHVCLQSTRDTGLVVLDIMHVVFPEKGASAKPLST